MRPKSASRSFAAWWRRSASRDDALRVALRVQRDRDAGEPELAGQVQQLERVAQVALGKRRVGGERRVAVQREQVVDALVAVALQQLDELGAVMGGAGEVRQRHERRADEAHDEVVGALTGRAAGAVGDRDERGGEGRQRFERLVEGQRGLRRAGRPELERDEPAAEPFGDAGHTPSVPVAANPLRSERRTVVHRVRTSAFV